ERSVGHDLLPALDEPAAPLQGKATVLEVSPVGERLEPGHPLLHHLLRSFGGPSGLSAAIKKHEVAHRLLLLSAVARIFTIRVAAPGNVTASLRRACRPGRGRGPCARRWAR